MNEEVDVSSIVEQQKLNSFLVALVVGSWVITFFDGFDMNVISFAAPYIAPQFHLDKVMMGKVFSIGLAGTMVGGFLFGYLGDKIGRRPSIIAATAAFSVLTMAIAFSKSYEQLLTLRFLDGIAIGGMLPLSWALNIEYAPKRFRATIVTTVMVGYSLGTALGGPVTVWLAPRYGWGSVFLVGGGLSLLSAIGLLVMLPESVRYLASQGRKPETIARIVRRLAPDLELPANPRFVITDEAAGGKSFNAKLLFENELRVITPLLWIAYIFSSMTAFFLATWTPLVFEALGFSRQTAALAATVNSAFGALGGLSLMRFTDRFGAIAITVMPLLAIPLLLVAAFADLGSDGFLVASAFITLFLIGGHFGLHSIAGIFYPSAYRSNGTGWATSVAKIGSIAGPYIAGLILATSLPVRNIFAVLAICPAVFVVCILMIGRMHTKILGRETKPAAVEANLVVQEAQ
ncbi:MFS transporter [Bradyrhizobium sp.]|uniref:MFS transporter n=1 Tax=Bradyrhizobium sp. TaxID=376 RepID=UPI001ECACC62|nr:MFS transporter [Bradyrhizobium sp.]MBV8916769.1 MFS transporter [Bradyrhizobium sp.]MBV9983308.1 MFS transporter [Bradyrhizobium sp.]